jgi:hypothetical protein
MHDNETEQRHDLRGVIRGDEAPSEPHEPHERVEAKEERAAHGGQLVADDLLDRMRVLGSEADRAVILVMLSQAQKGRFQLIDTKTRVIVREQLVPFCEFGCTSTELHASCGASHKRRNR